MRYKGQGYELRVPFTDDYVEAFHKLHEQRYGYSDPRREIEVVNVRSRVTMKTEKPSLPKFPVQPGEAQPQKTTQHLRQRKVA